MHKNSRIFIAGHTGLIGSAIFESLRNQGYQNLICIDRRNLDLTDQNAVDLFFTHTKPQFVFLAAGKVGGILENTSYPANFITENLAIQLNVLRASHRINVERLILFGSSCMYPRECSQPMNENALLTGHPEPTSIAYAIAKLAGVQMCQAYNRQFGENKYIPIIPNSVYGPNDDFSQSGHVLSSLIVKFHNAKKNSLKEVVLWGTGRPKREFIYSADVASACINLMSCDLSDIELPLNLGCGSDISIFDLAKLIAQIVGYNGEIKWDSTKPDGAPRKLLDSQRLRALGWSPTVDLQGGIKSLYQSYCQNCAS